MRSGFLRSSALPSHLATEKACKSIQRCLHCRGLQLSREHGYRGSLVPGSSEARHKRRRVSSNQAVAERLSSADLFTQIQGLSTSTSGLSQQSSDGDVEDQKLVMLLNSIQPLNLPSAREAESLPSTSGRDHIHGLPVYVMLPLDSIWLTERNGIKRAVIKRQKALDVALRTLKRAGVEGVMVDVWWGLVEAVSPQQYDFTAYRQLFEKARQAGLKVQAVMSFHAAGGNVGDTCNIPLPHWVVEVEKQEPDIFYTDATGIRNRECLSLGCDCEPLFQGRTPVEMYQDFTEAFVDCFEDLFGSTIMEVTVGMGPAGELRYPSYPEGDGRWRFPGVGEFQCYDRFMLANLKESAARAKRPEWGWGGPHDAGNYNSRPSETGFFMSQGGSWDTDYGHFFLSWYSGMLLQHAQRILTATMRALDRHGVPRKFKGSQLLASGETVYSFERSCAVGIKLAGVHWWFKSRSHAAELTAGYYNTRHRNGYTDVMRLLARQQAKVSFTCVEMRDCEHPPEGRCSPQGLLEQIIESSREAGVPLAGENALQRYDRYAFDRIAESAFGQNARAGYLDQLTFLRMGDLMFENFTAFSEFLDRLRRAS